MSAVIIAGEVWELPPAARTLRALSGRDGTHRAVLVPPELGGLAELAQVPPYPQVGIVGEPPGRFRDYREIAADLARRYPGVRIVAAGSDGSRGPDGAPVHSPPYPRQHVRRRAGGLDVWTADTGDGYFRALTASAAAGPAPPVWAAYGAGRPVFTRNTNDFGELAPPAHDDYMILGSGLLGWRMVLESEPGPGARVFVYDINPGQLEWSRHVLREAARIPDLSRLEQAFAATWPYPLRGPLPHERANAGAQARWYAAHHQDLGALARRVQVEYLLVDLLSSPAVLLSRLRPDRSAFFMYLDLFTVWHVGDSPPWIIELPGLARSLEREVRRASAAASFLPGPSSRTLQLDGSPFIRDSRGDSTCT
jgi:hypothetical protein